MAATLGCVVLGIGGIGTAGLVAMVAIWFVLSDVASLPMPLSGPRYTFDDMAVTDACSGIFDYCVRATCLVRNVGTSDGTATVLFDLDPHTTQPSQATETVIVPVGTARAVSHDFPEAGAFSDHNVECHFR